MIHTIYNLNAFSFISHFSDEDIVVIESFLEEALANTDVRLNNYTPSTLTDQRSLAATPSVASSRLPKNTPRDGSTSRGSHLSKAQERSASPMKKRQLPFTHAPMKLHTIKGTSNMTKR